MDSTPAHVIRGALIRAYRVAVYTFVGSAGVGQIPAVRSAADLKSLAGVWALALITAAATGLVAFLVGTAEGVADRPLIGPAPHSLPNGTGAPTE